MQKNEYRRALIMLRSLRGGYAGHARQEQRTLMGDLYITASAPEAGELRAALAGSSRGGWFAADAGTLRRDSRGQAAGRFHYDPRNVAGRDMDAYSQLLILAPNGDVALAGSLRGGQVDWAAMLEAVRNLFRRAEEYADTLPEAETAAENGPEAPENPEGDAAQGGSNPWIFPAPAAEAGEQAPAKAPETEAQENAVDAPEPAEEAPGDGGIAPETPAPEPERSSPWIVPAPAEKAEGQAAGNAPEAEPEPSAPEDGADAADAGEGDSCAMSLPEKEGYVFVRVPVPVGCGYSCAAIGLRREGDRVAGVCYALPGGPQAEPPAGMEDYAWQAFDGRGWWLSCMEIPAPAEV